MAIEPVTREERFLAAAGGRSVTPPTPITRKEQLLQGIIDAVQSGGATPDVIENAVNNYLEANPVKPGATTEQAAQIEQNKTDIADLQTEIDDKQPKGDYVKTVNGNKPDESGDVVVEVPEGGGGSLQWHFVEEVITTEEVGWLALEIPEAAVEAALYVVVAASDSLTSNIRADAWKKAAPTKGGCEVTLGNAGTSAKKYLARAAKYGDKIRNEQVFYIPYPTNAQVAHSGSDLHDPEGPYYIVSTPYGTSMIPIGTTISLFAR